MIDYIFTLGLPTALLLVLMIYHARQLQGVNDLAAKTLETTRDTSRKIDDKLGAVEMQRLRDENRLLKDRVTYLTSELDTTQKLLEQRGPYR